MKVYFHPDFNQVYTADPAADPGRMESIMSAIEPVVEVVTPTPADEADIALVHTREHIDRVKKQGLYAIAALAAGGAIQTALAGMEAPCFGAIRPPGHHASADSCWGFCFFNNMAIAMSVLKQRGLIQTGFVLDIDMHYGDGTVNTIGGKDTFTVHNIETQDRDLYLKEVRDALQRCDADIIGISSGFDNHINDWGGVLLTEDYRQIGTMVRETARQQGSGYFAILEGGYNHAALGRNTLALISGLAGHME